MITRHRFFPDICTLFRTSGMYIKSVFYILLFSFVLFQGCKNNSGKTVSIQGAFKEFPSTEIYVSQILPSENKVIDSVKTDEKGNFTISFPIDKAGFFSIGINPFNEITLVVSPGEKITLNADKKSIQNSYTISGSVNSELFAQYNSFTSANLKKVDSLSAIFAESRSKTDFQTVKNRLDSAYMHIFEDQKAKVIQFVIGHPGSLSSLLVISNNFGPNKLLTEQSHPELFLKLDSALTISYPENSLVISFHQRMLDLKAEVADQKEHEKFLKPGLPAPEIVLPNQAGKPIKLSSQKGKLTLVYFWSSWNSFSRQTNIKLTSIYTKFHNTGFEIYAVSIDSDTELWQKAYMLDKAYWIQVNDVKGLGSEYCKTYSVKAIPKMILVGKDGNILTENLSIEELTEEIKKNL